MTAKPTGQLSTVIGDNYRLTFDITYLGTGGTIQVCLGTTDEGFDVLDTGQLETVATYEYIVTAQSTITYMTIISDFGDPWNYEEYVRIDNIFFQPESGGGYFQTIKGLAKISDPTARYEDDQYREEITAKANSNHISPTIQNLYAWLIKAFGLTTPSIEDKVGHVDIEIIDSDLVTQGQRYRLAKAPRSAGIMADIKNWTLEYWPWEYDVSSDFSITGDTIDTVFSKVLHLESNGGIYLPTSYFGTTTAESATGTWEFLIKRATASGLEINFISDLDTFPLNCYRIYITSTGVLYLMRLISGSGVFLFTASVTISNNVWYKLRIERNSSYQFSVYLDDILIPVSSGTNPVTDSTHTESSYIGIYFTGSNSELALWDFNGNQLTKYIPL